MMAGISSKAANITPNKEKTFQGQRFDDELGLNWVQFKWRNHDPQIGRFIEIDPLANKYVDNSTYAFSENHVTSHVELEGKEKFPVNVENFSGDPKRLPIALQAKNNQTVEAQRKSNVAQANKKFFSVSKAGPAQIKHGITFTGTFTFGAQFQVEYDKIGAGAGIAVDLLGIRDNKSVAFATTAGEEGSKVRKYAEVASPVASGSIEKEEKTVNEGQKPEITEKSTVTLFGFFNLNTQTNKETNTSTAWLSLGASFKLSLILGIDSGIDVPIKELGTWNTKK